MTCEHLENRRMLAAQHPAFDTVIDNPFMPLTPGTKYLYKGISDGEHQKDLVSVIGSYTKTISGVICTVVLDRVFNADGEVVERTHDFFAQDKKGNVWYFGEDTKEFENGVVSSTEGSFKAGVNGAKPGIAMEANPQPEDLYFQENSPGVAEDQANVKKNHVPVKTPFRNFSDSLQIAEFTALEPGVVTDKFYVSGIGEVKEVDVKGGTEKFELVRVTPAPT